MDNREEFLSEILRRVQRKYVHMIEIERLTKDMGHSLSRNDRESAELILNMRGQEMEQAETVKRELQIILQAMDGEEKEKMGSWLKGEETYEPDCFEARKIVELSAQTQQVLNRTISLDKALNVKLAGKSSYYYTQGQ